MEHKERYHLFKMANQLITTNGFELLHINKQVEEVWLEKFEQKTSKVVRITTLGFDWKNHLKRDIAIVFQKTKAMEKFLHSKHIEIYNVYISPHTPVDSWEVLKKPMMIQENNHMKMTTYYLSGEEFQTEQDRLGDALGVTFTDDSEQVTETEMEQEANRFKAELYHSVETKRKNDRQLFSYGKPIITYILLALNVLMYIWLELHGGSENTATLIDYGAKYNPAIMDGEWWRIVTSMFLHIGLAHIASNMLFLYYFGTLAEKIYGSTRFFIIYMLAGIGGGVASFALMSNLSAGASGALYGLFGAFFYFGIFNRRIFFQTIGKNVLVLLAINVGLGFVLPQLDFTAHLGGLVAGFIASAIVHLPKKKKPVIQIVALIGYAALIVITCLFGIEHNENNPDYHLMEIQTLLDEENYPAVVESATKGLENPGDSEAMLLFQRSYALIQLNEAEKATKDLEKCVEVMDNPADLPQAYFNLAILYYNSGDERAREVIQKAYELSPNNENVQDLYETITGEEIGE